MRLNINGKIYFIDIVTYILIKAAICKFCHCRLQQLILTQTIAVVL